MKNIELNNDIGIKCNTANDKIKIILDFSEGSTVEEVLTALELSKRKIYTMLNNFIVENEITGDDQKAVYNMNIKGLMDPDI